MKKSEKLDLFIKPAYELLEDILAASQERPLLRNRDIEQRIKPISKAIDFGWIEQAVSSVDELVLMVRRNIQKTAALDAMIIKLRNQPRVAAA
jgi:DNA polymerase III subunit delta'